MPKQGLREVSPAVGRFIFSLSVTVTGYPYGIAYSSDRLHRDQSGPGDQGSPVA